MMSKEPWHRRILIEPATRAQVGALAGELERRHGLHDRTERLAVCATLLGLDHLGSTRDLTMGQAGVLLNIARRARDRAELDGFIVQAVADRKKVQASDGVTLVEILGQVASAIAAAFSAGQ
jgi:hypothetical protein